MSLQPVGASLPQPRFWTSALSSLSASVTLRPPGDARVSVRGSIMLQSAVSGPPSLLSGGLKVPSDISWNAPHRIYLSNVILCLSVCLSIYLYVGLFAGDAHEDGLCRNTQLHPSTTLSGRALWDIRPHPRNATAIASGKSRTEGLWPDARARAHTHTPDLIVINKKWTFERKKV